MNTISVREERTVIHCEQYTSVYVHTGKVDVTGRGEIYVWGGEVTALGHVTVYWVAGEVIAGEGVTVHDRRNGHDRRNEDGEEGKQVNLV